MYIDHALLPRSHPHYFHKTLPLDSYEYLMLMARPRLYRLICACCCIVSSLLYIPPTMAEGTLATKPFAISDTLWYQPAPLATALEDTAKQSDGYNWQGAPPEQPDWRGIRRDTAYFLGYQFVAVTVLYFAPESISGWDSEDKEDSEWKENVSTMAWDEDSWWINYVLHPYWGGAYYVRARERGLDRTQSFWFSALLSTLWEYGAEALAETVSIQDMVVTPVVGSLVGEYLLSPVRERIRNKPGKLDWSDKVTLFITDPLCVINAETDRLLGVETTLQWQPIAMRLPEPVTGIDSTITRMSDHEPVWGIQLTVVW